MVETPGESQKKPFMYKYITIILLKAMNALLLKGGREKGEIIAQ